MEGPDIFSNENKGLTPRMIDHIFGAMKNMENFEITIKISMVEIYNERIRDLLDTGKFNLEIHENPSTGIYIKDATEIYVSTETEV